MRYTTFSYLNWRKNGEPLKFEVQKNCMKKVHFTIWISISQKLFSDFKLWWLAVSMPVEVGKIYIPQKKALLSIVWKKFWNWTNFQPWQAPLKILSLLHSKFQTQSTVHISLATICVTLVFFFIAIFSRKIYVWRHSVVFSYLILASSSE